MENYGVLSLLPVAVVIVLVFLTKRTTVSLLAGTLVGAVMLYGVHFAKPWLEVVYGVMGSELWIWLVLVCGFFGSLVALFEASGGIYGFTDIAAKICKGRNERCSPAGCWGLSPLWMTGCPSSLWAQQCGGPRTGFTFPGKCWPFSAMPRRLLSV